MSFQTQTETGLALGITDAETISRSGNAYRVLQYPPAVQREIVKYYTELRIQLESGGDQSLRSNF